VNEKIAALEQYLGRKLTEAEKAAYPDEYDANYEPSEAAIAIDTRLGEELVEKEIREGYLVRTKIRTLDGVVFDSLGHTEKWRDRDLKRQASQRRSEAIYYGCLSIFVVLWSPVVFSGQVRAWLRRKWREW
jgi:hypothetical protein